MLPGFMFREAVDGRKTKLNTLMSSETAERTPYSHIPVMRDEIVEKASSLPAGTFLDATLGGGGHAHAILSSCSDLHILGVDQDAMALTAARQSLSSFPQRVSFVQSRFDRLDTVPELAEIELSGFLFDLGVSSPQLDIAERGFSYNHDAPLDMRMDQGSSVTASEIVNEYSMEDLRRTLWENADEKFANRIAKTIVRERPVETTKQLASLIVSAIPAAARRTGGHPAKRTFQALRIEVNNELEILQPALHWALDRLSVGGVGMVLSYHSGEDKRVKAVFRKLSTSEDPPGLPEPVSIPNFKLSNPRFQTPNDAELAANRRASSARFRSITRISR